MEHVTFPNGLKMPLVGFGTSQVRSHLGDPDKDWLKP